MVVHTRLNYTPLRIYHQLIAEYLFVGIPPYIPVIPETIWMIGGSREKSEKTVGILHAYMKQMPVKYPPNKPPLPHKINPFVAEIKLIYHCPLTLLLRKIHIVLIEMQRVKKE